MKTRTVIERIGENMGPVDWSYNFRQHFDGWCVSEARREEMCAEKVALLRDVVRSIEGGEALEARLEGDHFYPVYDVGMYDGWPWWRPVPSICTGTPLNGSEWHGFYSISAVRVRETKP